MLRSINPYNNEILGEFELTPVEDLDNNLDLAQNGFVSWRQTSFDQRSQLLMTLASTLRKNKDTYARLISQEMGKVLKESKKEVDKSAMVLEYFAEHGEEYLAEEKIHAEKGKGFIIYEPMGVVLSIMPWNYPFWQFFRFAATTLMAGNSILLKHSSQVPMCAQKIADIFEAAHFPEGVFQNIRTSSSNMHHIIKDFRVQAASLTGGVAAGSEIAKYAGSHIKKVVLELGGSDPFIVMNDANIEKAAQAGVKARMKNFGQSCDAAKRFILHRDIAGEFLQAFRKEMELLTFGDPLDEATDYASLSSKEQKELLDKQVDHSLQMGAEIYWRELKSPDGDAFFNPMILTHINPESPAYREELFGPVASVFEVKDDKEAILIANDTDYGLGASVWSGNMERARKMADKVEAGFVCINEEVHSKPQLPFGGVKKSGLGREMAGEGIREFTNKKSLWYPMGDE